MQNVVGAQVPVQINEDLRTVSEYEFLGIRPENIGINKFYAHTHNNLRDVLEFMHNQDSVLPKTVILDNDGVLHHGTTQVKHAKELIKHLQHVGISPVVATNIKSRGFLRRFKRPEVIKQSFLQMGLEETDIYHGQNRQEGISLISRPDLPPVPTKNRELPRFEASKYLNLVKRIYETVKEGGEIHLVADEPWLRKQMNLFVGGREEYFLYRIANDLRVIHGVDLDLIEFHLHIIDTPVDMPLFIRFPVKIIELPRRKMPKFFKRRSSKSVDAEM